MQEIETMPMPKTWPELLDSLNVNESMGVSDEKIETCRTSISRFHKNNKDKKFVTRKLDDNSEVRIWRIK